MEYNFNILGSHKTGTSTMVGLLNCHPEIYCYYEYMYDGKLKNPEVELPELLGSYKWLGDKNPLLGSIEEIDNRVLYYDNMNIVFCYRNIEDWLAHKYVANHYGSYEDVVGPSIRYIYYLIKSFDFPNVIRVRLEDLLAHDTDGVLSDFIFF